MRGGNVQYSRPPSDESYSTSEDEEHPCYKLYAASFNRILSLRDSRLPRMHESCSTRYMFTIFYSNNYLLRTFIFSLFIARGDSLCQIFTRVYRLWCLGVGILLSSSTSKCGGGVDVQACLFGHSSGLS